jgi:hypothetical protein
MRWPVDSKLTWQTTLIGLRNQCAYLCHTRVGVMPHDLKTGIC